jgi:HEAT repeat protein
LKGIVANRLTPLDARQAALAGLMATDWNGQEEWVISLFADPTLSNLREVAGDDDAKTRAAPDDEVEKATMGEVVGGGWGILADVLDMNVEKWFPVIKGLVDHNHRTVHQSAVKCLASFLGDDGCDKKCKNEIAQKLSPWLTDPNWVATEDRRDFIESLVDLQAPELLPGLIWVLEHDGDQNNRAAAAEALTQYRDQRANPALRRALEKEEGEENRGKIVTALAEMTKWRLQLRLTRK